MELKEEKKGGSQGVKGRERKRQEGGTPRGRERERDLVKNGHPAREDSLRLRRTMRPCSGRDSFLVRGLRTRRVCGSDEIDTFNRS